MEGKEKGVEVQKRKKKGVQAKGEGERKGSWEFRGAERRRPGWREKVVEWRRRSGEVEERVAEERSGGAGGRKVEAAGRWGGKESVEERVKRAKEGKKRSLERENSAAAH